MIGSHNTMSYSPVKQWYLRPLKWAFKCQSKDLFYQIIDYGVRLVDFRVRFDKNGDLHFAHGLAFFKEDVNEALKLLALLAQIVPEQLYCRVILESNKEMKDQALQEEHFRYFCEEIQAKYPAIRFFGGNRKYDWKVVYDFNTEEPTLDDKYSSTTELLGGKHGSLRARIDDIFPWLYARLHNKKNRIEGTKKDFLFLDFVNI